MRNLLSTIFIILLVITITFFIYIGYKMVTSLNSTKNNAQPINGVEVQTGPVNTQNIKNGRIYQFTIGTDNRIYTILKGIIIDIDLKTGRIRLGSFETPNDFIDVYVTNKTEFNTSIYEPPEESESSISMEPDMPYKNKIIQLTLDDFKIGDSIIVSQISKEHGKFITDYVTK